MNFYIKEYWINKGMTEEQAIEKVKDLRARTNRYCVDFWLRKGLTETESKEKISEIQRINNSKVDQSKKPTTTRLEYWLSKGYDLEEAKEKLKERQTTFTLQKCIEKYGELEGEKNYKERQEKWQKTLNENNNKEELNKKRGLNKEKFIEKHGQDKYDEYCKKKGLKKEQYIEKFGIEKYTERINNLKNTMRKNGFNKYSKISNELFAEIKKFIDSKCYYGKNERIIQFYDDEGKYFCFYVDFMCENKIIEFYGDYFHGNPELYKPGKIIGSKYKHFNIEEIWERDSIREKLIKDRGFEILVIWENDYKKNKEKIINKCIEWIKNL